MSLFLEKCIVCRRIKIVWKVFWGMGNCWVRMVLLVVKVRLFFLIGDGLL